MGRGTLTFQVLDGIDKGRIFRELSTPVTLGREEGNSLRLNDERISRFHAKVQIDNDDVIVTDLESTNGTRVNGTTVQIRRLRVGDRIGIGRSLLLFGSNEEIAARMAELSQQSSVVAPPAQGLGKTGVDEGGTGMDRPTLAGQVDGNLEFDLNLDEPVRSTSDALFIGVRQLPPLPLKLSPSQAARVAEIFDYLHQGLTQGTDNLQAKDDGSLVTIPFSDWQRIQAVQMLLSRYLRMVAEPPEGEK